MKSFFATVLLATTAAADFEKDVLPVLNATCLDCHDGKHGEGGIDLFPFGSAADVAADKALWKRVLDAVDYHEMPPPGEDIGEDEREKFVAWVRAVVTEPDHAGRHDPGPPLFRRLTRLEYNNTLRDLLGLPTDVFTMSERLPLERGHAFGEPLPETLRIRIREYGAKYPVMLREAGLPGDSKAANGFTNQTNSLSLSPLLLEKYVETAGAIVEHPEFPGSARRMGEILPGVRPAAPAVPKPTPSNLIADATDALAPNGNVPKTADGSAFDLDAFRARLADAFAEDRGGVLDGESLANTSVPGKGAKLRIAYGANARRVLALNPSEDIWITGFGTAEESSGGILFANREKNLKTFHFGVETETDRPEAGISELGLVVLSRRGHSGKVTVSAEFEGGEKQSVSVTLAAGVEDNTFVSFKAPEGRAVRRIHIDGSDFSGEYVLLDDLAFITRDPAGGDQATVAGRELPTEEAPPPSAAPAPSINRELASAPARDRLGHFLSRAFRRPAADDEIERYLAIHKKSRDSGADDTAAMTAALRVILASPTFLHRIEEPRPPGGLRQLGGHEIASRLSYFLWSSMPDDALFAAAAEGRLDTAEDIAAQAVRMLRDPKARELAESFAFQWLHLNVLFGSRPDPRRFRDFYSGPQGKDNLGGAMITEVLLAFEKMLAEDASVLDLLDSREAYLNGPLLKLYGIDREGDGDRNVWRKITWPDRSRGGVITAAGPLTLTSLPLRTSPVYRGSWMLEAIFNRPPPPPPAQVDELGEDDRKFQKAGLTLREKLEEHRSRKSCMGCHSRIDDLGFALENFDPIGRWRQDYGTLPVDSTGALLTGGSFAGPAEFKDALLQRKERFVRAFAEHLLTYALGRDLTHHDHAAILGIVETARENDYRFSALLAALVASEPFRFVRNPDPDPS